MGPETQRFCNTFCRPLNVSARAQARNAVAPMFGARALRGAHMVTILRRRAKRGALLFAFSFFFAKT